MPGVGSQNSPIFISDDDDDEIQALSPTMNASFPRPTSSIPGLPARPMTSLKQRAKPVQKGPIIANGNGNIAEASRIQRKRKREQSNQSNDAPGPSTLSSVSSVITNKKPKRSHRRALKERRRLAEEMAARTGSLQGPGPFAPGYPNNQYPYHPSFQQDPQELNYDADYYPIEDYMDLEDSLEQDVSSSDWVNSMARVADPPSEAKHASWDQNNSAHWPPLPHLTLPSTEVFVPPPPPLPVAPSLPPPPIYFPPLLSVNQSPPSSEPFATIPQGKQVTFTPLRKIVGLPTDRDPDGKRSGFKLSPNTVLHAQEGLKYPHTPVRSNTIIMEQLPKQNRDPEFILSWGEKVTGAAPIFLAVDSSSAKALVEFSSHALARKAWSSPKLGKHLTSLSPTELKGKPREDLIRVWWYKPSTPELVFERSELEEGEIEDLAAVEKESKKERKARLAKQVREEKEQQKETAIQAAAILEKEKVAAQATSSAEATLHSYLPPVTAIPPLLPSLLAPLPPLSLPVGAHPFSWSSLPSYSTRPQSATTVKPPISAKDQRPSPPASPDHHLEDQDESVIGSDMIVDDSTVPLPPTSRVPNLGSSNGTILPSAVIPPLKPQPPSEPRAMKNAPTSPSFSKRALLARQKQLEERIALGKLEIERRNVKVKESTTIKENYEPTSPVPSPMADIKATPAPVAAESSFVQQAEVESSTKSVQENHLRNLVLASRRQVKATTVPQTANTVPEVAPVEKPAMKESPPASAYSSPPPTSALPTPASTSAPPTSASSPSVPPPSAPSVVQTSLDALAESFITETIQTLKLPPSSAPAFAPSANIKPQSQSNAAALVLAARQKQLEQQIAETKKLMDSLKRASSKQEKDKILESLRQLSRSPATSAPSTPALPAAAPPKLLAIPPVQSVHPMKKSPVQTIKFTWPMESLPERGILILSDDEDEDE